MSLEDGAVKVMAGSETNCPEELDDVVLGHLTSSPLDPFPPKDFRRKFKKMRQKKRPTILESRCCFKLREAGGEHFHNLPVVFKSVINLNSTADKRRQNSAAICITL